MKRPIWVLVLVLGCSSGSEPVEDVVEEVVEQDIRQDITITIDYGVPRDTKEVVDVQSDADAVDILARDLLAEDNIENQDTEPEPGYFGAPCTENRQCYSGFCVQSSEGRVCTKNCLSSTCPDNWECRSVPVAGDPVYICVPQNVWLCRPCNSSDDCSTTLDISADKCVAFGSIGNFCGTACGEDEGPCPEGFSCEEVSVLDGGTSFQCVPETGECGCSPVAVDVGATTTCFISNSNGVCTGVRECLEGGLTSCDARTPAIEACNKVDDDCDGETDNEGSVGCTPYYVDNDQDGWGIGIQHCVCGETAPVGYSNKPGDCNDSSYGMNPAVAEVCNGMDDNCDGITDEPGAVGCREYSLDNDGDGFGVPGERRCLCNPTPPFTGVIVGDCDDTNPAICPDSDKCKEKCDGIDNDCDDVTDGENALLCTPYYFDADQDTYGLPTKFKCLCGPTGLYTATRAGDCVDTDPEINSTGDELCNGIDDNCNGKTDEGDIEVLCPAPPGVELHGSTICDKVCKIGSCDGPTTDATGNYVPAWYDLNETATDGCECQADAGEEFGGQTCNSAVNLGNVPDSGFRVASDQSRGSVVPATDVDWYRFQASDPTWSGETGNCDNYNVRIKFIRNPGNQFMFDVYRGSCASANQICGGSTNHEWAVNFSTGTGSSRRGECPCSSASAPGCDTPVSYTECIRVESDPYKCGTCPGYGALNTNVCSNNTSEVYIRIFRDPLVTPTCEGYEFEISNGLYPYSGT